MGKYLCRGLFLIKLQAFTSATILKRDSNTGVFLWFCEIFKNIYFEEHLWTICTWKVYLYINQRVLSQIFFQIFLRLSASLCFKNFGAVIFKVRKLPLSDCFLFFYKVFAINGNVCTMKAILHVNSYQGHFQ